MVKGLFAYHDALNGYVNVFPEVSNPVAIRGFRGAIEYAQEGSLFYSNPEDYSLWRVGSFDTDTGEIIPETPVVIERGKKKNV